MGRLIHEAPPPNVLFVLADQWRFSAFSHESDNFIKTPNIDKLAAQGVRCTRAYATFPVCTPNRAALLTGRYPHQTGMMDNNLMLPPGERCVAHSFCEAQYATHYIGKWHLDGPEKPGFVPPGWRRRGFTTFEGFNRGHGYYDSPVFSNDGKPLKPGGFEPTDQTDRAIEFMNCHRDRRFFCFLSWGPPHTPYEPPQAFDRFTRADIRWRPNVPPATQQDPLTCRELCGYAGLCESLDAEMGRLLGELESLGLVEDTLVVFTSDHGDMHGSHGLHRKCYPHEESLHIPLLLRWPGKIRADRTLSTLIGTVDVMPTLLSLCGIKTPETSCGWDLSPDVLGPSTNDGRSIYCEGYSGNDDDREWRDFYSKYPGSQSGYDENRNWRAVITGQHKLVIDRNKRASHLFDLTVDPFEIHNLANVAEYAVLQEQLLNELQRLSKKTGDPFPGNCVSAHHSYSDSEAMLKENTA